MFNQPFGESLEQSDFFDDKMVSRPIPPHTVHRGEPVDNEVLLAGKIGTNLVAAFPFSIDREALARGRKGYEIYCAACHGRTGEGNGMIVQRGFPAPPSLHSERLRAAPVGHFYDVIRQGYGIMYSYASQVELTNRWEIAAYIRVLQLSRNARLADVPPDERTVLEITQ